MNAAQAVQAGKVGALDRSLRDVFGFDGLRPGQAEVVADILDGKPVVAVMPTGAGKSLCYQLPAVVLGERGGVTLVVSPLIALMKDQVDALTARGVPAAALTSAASPEQQRDILDGMRAGAFTLVYVAPERFKSPRFLDALRAIGDRLALVAIDEAHCISEWGHDFRPDYRRLGDAVRALRTPRLAAFTATATPEVRVDIAEQLAMKGARVHVRGFDRPNLHYAVDRVRGIDEKTQRLIQLARTRDSGVALIYAATRKNAEKYGEALGRAGMRVRVYHAGLDDKARDEAQDVFMAGKLDAIVATNAFGMGIDKADIRVVVHADIPRSPEAYYQECGRGGRDGRATKCVLLFGAGDVRLQEFLIDASYPSPEVLRGLWKLLKDRPDLGLGAVEDRVGGLLPGEPHASTVAAAIRILERHGLLSGGPGDGGWTAVRPEPGVYPPLDVEAITRRAEVERSKLKAMIDYAWSARCRRQQVLAYFGDEEWGDPGKKCGACDVCDAVAHGRVGMDAETKRGIERVLLLIGSMHGRFGRTRIAALANGTDDDPRYEDLPERGCLRWPQKDLLDLLRSLEGAGLVEASRGEYPTISTTRRGDLAALGKLDVGELVRVIAPAPRKPRAKKPGWKKR